MNPKLFHLAAVIQCLALPVLCLPPGSLLAQQPPASVSALASDGWVPPPPVRSGRAQFTAARQVRAPKFVQSVKTDASDVDINSSKLLEVPLVRRSKSKKKGARALLTKAVNEYAAKSAAPSSERLAVLTGSLDMEPDSDISPSLWLEAGRTALGSAHFNTALKALTRAWEQTRNEQPDSPAYQLAEMALGQLAVLYMRTGMRSQLKALLAQIEGRPPHVFSKSLVDRARERLHQWDTDPLASVECGVVAYNFIAEMIGMDVINRYTKPQDDEQAAAVATWGIDLEGAQKSELIERGLSAVMLQRRIHTASTGWKWVYRSAGSAIPVPSIAHLQFANGVGHYSAVVEIAPGRVRLQDPFLAVTDWIELKALNQTASGFFLVPHAENLPDAFQPAADAQMEHVFGRAACPSYSKLEGEPCPRPECEGMMVGTITDFIPHVAVFDQPLTYRPLWGPAIDFTLEYHDYRSYEADAWYWEGDTSYFGSGWKHNLLTYIRSSDGLPITGANSTLQWVTPSTFFNYSRSGSAYVSRDPSRPQLTPITGGYRLTFSNGSQMDFTQANAGTARRYYLSRVRDESGYELVLHYDSLVRLSKIVDATGKETLFSYASPTSMVIERITDPFGRYASFSYTGYWGTQLNSIRDALGLVSTIQHGSGGISITTPYGQTSFQYLPGGVIQKTDPAGYVTRKAYVYHDGYTSFSTGPKMESRPPSSIPAGGSNVAFLTTVPVSDHFHCTVEWNRKQWKEYQKALATDPNADKNEFAEITLWLQVEMGVTGPVPLCHKLPGQAAEWYNYPGQPKNSRVGTFDLPSKTARQTEDENGQLRWVVKQQTYTATGQPQTFIDELGRTTTLNYSGSDITSVVAGGNTLRSFTYFTDAGRRGMPHTVTEASGLTTTYERNAKGQPTLITVSKGGNSEATRMTYTALASAPVPAWSATGTPGLLRRIERSHPTTPNQWVTTDTFTYDDIGRVRTHTDAGGYMTRHDYDDFDRPTLITHPDNSTEQFHYDRLDLVATKDRAGRWTRTPHDAIQRPMLAISPGNKVTQYTWCSCGSLSKLTDPAGRVTEWKRDILGRVTEKIMPDLVTKTTYSYYPRSARLASMRRPNDKNSPQPTVSYSYLVDGRLHKEDYSDNSVSSGVADLTHTYEPGGLGRLLYTTDSFLGYTQYTYRPLNADGGGAVETISGPLADDTLEYVYDWQGRVSTENLRSDTNAILRTETRTWDGLGRLATLTSALGTFTHNYSATDISRLESLSRPNGLSTAFGYLPHGTPQNVLGASASAMQSITHTLAGTPAATLASHTYGYDRAGRITSWQQQGQGITASTWSYGHNADGELLHAEKSADSAPNTPIDGENWSLDAAGNWLSHSRGSSAVMETRTHNSMNRLTAIGGGGQTVVEGTVNEFARVTVNGAAAQLSKDSGGDGFRYRRTVPVQAGTNTVTVQATDTGGATTTKQWQFSVPAATRSFTHDTNGNTLTDGQRTMTWDVKNRLRTVTKGTTTWKWDYDHADRRVKEYQYPVGSSSGAAFTTPTKIFIWSSTNVVQERNASNTITRTHYSGGFSDGAAPTTGTKYQLLTDHLGHVREIVDANGTIVTRYDYTSYQGPVKVSGTLEATFQTIGRYYHHAGSGLELALYRAYDAELGRWLSEDPIGERGGLNLYGYVGNSPVMAVDRLGLEQYIVFKPEALGGIGHPAFVAGNSDRGCSGYDLRSFSTGDSKDTNADNLQKEHFGTRRQLVDFLKAEGYTHYIFVPSTPEEDKKALDAIDKQYENTDYFLPNHNCATMTGAGLKANGKLKGWFNWRPRGFFLNQSGNWFSSDPPPVDNIAK